MAQSNLDTDPDAIDVEQYANETIRLETHIVGVMNSPTTVEGTVSSTGKTISAPYPHADGKTVRLDTAEVLAGNAEYRDSRAFSLYTYDTFQRTQKANLAPGPQAGAHEVSDPENLPDPTHEVVGVQGDEQDSDDDDRDDGDDGTDGRDEYGRIQEGERVHVEGEADNGDTLDDRGTVANVTGTKTMIELDDGRRVTKRGSVIVERTSDGPVFYRSPTMQHIPETATDDDDDGDADGQLKADAGRSDEQEDSHMAQSNDTESRPNNRLSNTVESQVPERLSGDS